MGNGRLNAGRYRRVSVGLEKQVVVVMGGGG